MKTLLAGAQILKLEKIVQMSGAITLFGRGDGHVANGRSLRRVTQFRIPTQITDDGDLVK